MVSAEVLRSVRKRLQKHPERVFLGSILLYGIGFLFLDYPLVGSPPLEELPRFERFYSLAWLPVAFGSWAISAYMKRRWGNEEEEAEEKHQRSLRRRVMRDLTLVFIGGLLLAGYASGVLPSIGQSVGAAVVFLGMLGVAATPHKRGLDAGLQVVKLYALLTALTFVIVMTTIRPESITSSSLTGYSVPTLFKTLAFSLSLFAFIGAVFGNLVVVISDWKNGHPTDDEIIDRVSNRDGGSE